MEPLYVMSVAAAHAAANLDELPIIFALIPIIGIRRAVGGYLIAQLIVIAAAFMVGAVAADLAAQHAHWLGLVPIALGLHALWRRLRDSTEESKPELKPVSFAFTILLFIGLSMDSFALMTAIFADSQAAFDLAALAGAFISTTAIAASGALFASVAAKVEKITTSLEAVAPFDINAVGQYVLADTATDTQTSALGH